MDELAQLSDLQLAVMRVLWSRGRATVAAVHDDLAETRELAPTTVSTLLSRLEKRGLVEHHTRGRQYVYRAAVEEQEVQRSMLDRVTDQCFAGDVTALVSHLITARDISGGDLDEVRRLIDRADQGDEEQRDDE